MLVSRSELDAVEDPSERLLLALRGVFAGNIFDLGAAASSQLFDNEGVSSCNSRQPSPVRREARLDNTITSKHCMQV